MYLWQQFILIHAVSLYILAHYQKEILRNTSFRSLMRQYTGRSDQIYKSVISEGRNVHEVKLKQTGCKY